MIIDSGLSQVYNWAYAKITLMDKLPPAGKLIPRTNKTITLTNKMSKVHHKSLILPAKISQLTNYVFFFLLCTFILKSTAL